MNSDFDFVCISASLNHPIQIVLGGTTYTNTKSVIPETIQKDESEFGKWENIYRIRKEDMQTWHKEV